MLGTSMIVCSCNIVTDSEIRATLASGACPRTPFAVYECLGCRFNCGRCIATVRTIINEANAEWIPLAPKVDGQFQVSTARNVAMTPPGCTTEAPGPFFQKEFFHNGYIKSLKQLVHFYNTRDVYGMAVESGQCPPGTEKVTCWPMPEVRNNIDMTTGNLALTDLEENQIVAFLQTLTDGFTAPYPNINTFTGACMTGAPGTANASASTQGNDSLIPTPPLPPCASAICGVAPFPSPPIP